MAIDACPFRYGYGWLRNRIKNISNAIIIWPCEMWEKSRKQLNIEHVIRDGHRPGRVTSQSLFMINDDDLERNGSSIDKSWKMCVNIEYARLVHGALHLRMWCIVFEESLASGTCDSINYRCFNFKCVFLLFSISKLADWALESEVSIESEEIFSRQMIWLNIEIQLNNMYNEIICYNFISIERE